MLDTIHGENSIAILVLIGGDGRVVALPENVQQLGIADLLRIKFDSDNFTVIIEVVVIRVLSRPASIADSRAVDSGDTPEPGVDTPESAQGEQGEFRIFRNCRINRRRFP